MSRFTGATVAWDVVTMTLRFELNTSLLGVGFGPRSKSTAGIMLCDMGLVGRSASRCVSSGSALSEGAAT